MKNVSTAFKQALSDGTPVYARAKITLSDGTELELTSENDFFINGNSYSEGGSDGFMLGETICKTISISIDNHDERFSKYDFYKSQIVLYSEVDLSSGAAESIREGIFTVVDSVAPGDIIEFNAYDNMYKANKKYTAIHSTAIRANLLLRNICSDCGLTLGTSDFKNHDFPVKKVPTGCTCRELIGYIAQIAGGNAYITSQGALAIKSYDLEAYNKIADINGGNLSDDLDSKIIGGNLADSLINSISSGDLDYSTDYHILCDFASDPEIATDDITITGLVFEVESESSETSTKEYLVGEKGYTLKVENPLIADDILSGLNLIAENVVGLTVRPFSGSFSPNPTIECMDNVLVIDRKYNTYRSIVTGFTYNYLGACDVENTTKPPEKNAAAYSSNASVVYQQAKELVEKNKSEWEQAVEDLDTTIKNSTGFYETKEVQDDKSIIYYLHDKPLLNESQLVIRITQDAIGISNTGKDGLYDVGINTVTGTAILKQIYTIGLNAQYITTGSLSADRISGGTLKIGGSNNGFGEIWVYNQNDVLAGSWKNASFKTVLATFTHQVTIGDSSANDVYQIDFKNYSPYIGESITFSITPTGETTSVDFEFGMLDDSSGVRGAMANILNNAKFIGIGGGNSRNFWYQRTAETHSYLGEITANTINSSVNFDMHNKTIYNSNFNGDSIFTGDLSFSGGLKIENNTDVKCFSDVDMANFTINNLRLNNIVGVGYQDKSPLSGTVPFIKSITAKPDGGISWTEGELEFENGILVGW